MGNCLAAQSGGPTAVINASLAGVVRANQLNPLYDRVFGGLHGVEGVLDGKLYDLTDLSGDFQANALKRAGNVPLQAQTQRRCRLLPANRSHVLHRRQRIDGHRGCTGKMGRKRRLRETLRGHSENHRQRPRARRPCARIAAQITHATYLDYAAYTRPEVFVLETMGRDAGWLATSCCVSGNVDLLVLPEIDFDEKTFLAEAKKKFDEKSEYYIVVSEGAHYADVTYVSSSGRANEGFAHPVLGGAGSIIKQMIVDAGIVPRGVVQNLS